jgi:hypothetical protein
MSDLSNDDWPSFSEELGRKGLKALDKWVQKRDAGEITLRELYLITDVLWDVMSGLASREDLAVVERSNEEIRNYAKQQADLRRMRP